MTQRHVNSTICPLCELKLADAHPQLAKWARLLREALPQLHVAWSHRSEKDQNDAVRRGTSKLTWPNSPHNKKPAEALDFFRLSSTGNAEWDPTWLSSALGPAARAAGLEYGGDWEKFRDFPHVQLAKQVRKA